jgi:putative hydrolase of the HAD superfamily
MAYHAVIFDLFGTLVQDFSRRQYESVLAQMAQAVGAPYTAFQHLHGQSYADRCLGRYASIEEDIAQVCAMLGLRVTSAQVAQAAQYRYHFTACALRPAQPVLDALRHLRQMGLRLGLLSDCGPDVPQLWSHCPLAPLIDVAVFSCQERRKKPDPLLYHTAAQRLGVTTPLCVYVGDGSSDELRGATLAGCLPILRRIALEDVYDRDRADVVTWQGMVVHAIEELPQVLMQMQ